MAVVPMWKCDRDGSMFDNKKEAEAHDKMLELAASFTVLFEKHLTSISEQESEQLGLLFAHNKELVIGACKGKPELLEELAVV